MQLFGNQKIDNIDKENFHFLLVEEVDHVLQITLNRAHKKNALHPHMVNEIAYAFQYAHDNASIWMIQLGAIGDVFCAGGDLKAMSGAADEHDSTIPTPSTPILLGTLFAEVHKPVITKVAGDVYAGGFILLSASHIVIAQSGIQLGLPEVKRGLYPFQVMENLLNVMPARKVIDWCIRGYNLPVEEAQRYGLVTEIVASDSIDTRTQQIIAELKQNSPTAISKGLEAYDHIRPSKGEHQYLFKMFMDTVKSPDGREGMMAFREKRAPKWTGKDS